jgi:ketol-acid reductoisomerase
MATITEERDIDLTFIQAKKVAVIGFGSQGHAHALNLRDSGIEVRVGLYQGSPSAEKAGGLGFEVPQTADAIAWADVVVLAVPDVKVPAVFNAAPFSAGQTVVFLHGFALHFGFVEPPPGTDVVLVSPAGPGPMLRSLYKAGSGFASLCAIAQDSSGNAKQTALAYAKAVGCAKAGVIDTTFKEETETDLFGEQAVLCGGLPELIKAGFRTLVEAGYQPEIAFFECVHQVKLITDLIYQGGLSKMRNSISGTAEWGGYLSGPDLIDKAAMQEVLKRIQSGEFANEWMKEHESGAMQLLQKRDEELSGTIEKVGAEMRARMPFLQDK